MKVKEKKYLVIDNSIETTNVNDKVITIEDDYDKAIRKGNLLCEESYQVITITIEEIEERKVVE